MQVSYFGFPKDKELFKKWIVAIRRDEGKHFKVSKSTKVCSKHFKDKDFLPGYVNGGKFLKEGIVPSTFRSSAPTVPRRKVQRRNTQPVSNPINMIAAAADDECDSTAAFENQPPPHPGVCVLAAGLQGQVAVQAARGVGTLYLNDSMRSRFRWIPHEPVRRRPKPRAVWTNKNAAGECLDVMPKGSQRTFVALYGDRLILDAMPIGI
ncbi:uncharacterized protein ISCGN_003453 [Ixodes scapularis]